MGLTLADLLPDYTASLNSARAVFGKDGTQEQSDNLTRHLRAAARALALEKRPRTRQGTFTLTAGVADTTDVPSDLLLPKVGIWGIGNLGEPWCLPPGPLPILTLSETDAGRQLTLTPAPSAAQIATFGAQYRYYYFAAHQITDDAATSTLDERDRNLVILRAQVEAMRETALRNAHMPVTLRDGMGSPGGNTTPSALYAALLAEYQKAA